MNRRRFLTQTGGVSAGVLGLTVLRPNWTVVAQDASPVASPTASLFADLGLPELRISKDESGFMVSPGEVASGWTLVTVENPSGEDLGPDIMMVPEGETVQGIMDMVSQSQRPPEWAYTTTWAGGPYVAAGQTGQAVVNLTAGDWMVWSGGDPVQPATLTVTGDAATPMVATPSMASPVALEGISAEVSVTMRDYEFEGLQDEVTSGANIWHVKNEGEEPHFMVLFSVPEGTTRDQLVSTFMGEMSGTPAADAVDMSGMQTVGGCSTMSIGQHIYLMVDLGPGTYGAVCFFPDDETGEPHVAEGMVDVFTVS